MLLSIDIGGKKVGVVEGAVSHGGVSIHRWGEEEYTDEVVVNGEIRDRTALEFLIKELLKSRKMSARRAVVTISSSDVISRDLKLPNVPPGGLYELVRGEMARFVGNSGDYVVDYTVTGQAEDGQLSLMTYAVPRTMVESYYNLLRACRLRPVAMDIHANALAKLVGGSVINGEPIQPENILIADVGYSQINFNGFMDGVFRFHRMELSPVQDFIREVTPLLPPDTENALRAVNLSPGAPQDDPMVEDACRYFSTRLGDIINKYCQYTVINSSHKKNPAVFLCGGASLIKGIGETLSESVSVPVKTLTSLDRVRMPDGAPLPTLCNAVGALIRKD